MGKLSIGDFVDDSRNSDQTAKNVNSRLRRVKKVYFSPMR